MQDRLGAGLLIAVALTGCSDSTGPDDGGGPVGAAVIATNITSDRTLYRDTIYTISGFIKVANGATLTIQDGTVIVGDYDVLGSSLFVLRGARIRALGTADRPIVFTSGQPVGQRRAGDWGGLILVGNARINRSGVQNIEGTGTDPVINPFVNYGQGTDDGDSSGELRYVRVEFAGFAPSDGNELNSFTFAAVGSGTTLSHLQSMYGLDDAFEWFGGTVDAKYLVSYDSGDDHFDMSEGYRGRLQHLIAYQSGTAAELDIRPNAGGTSSDPAGIENDGCNGAGCDDGHDSQPLTDPLVANFTIVQAGPGSWVEAKAAGGYGMVLRRGVLGAYINGVIARTPRAAISLRDPATGARIANGELVIRNVLLVDHATVLHGDQMAQLDVGASAIVDAAGNIASVLTSVPGIANGVADLDFTPAGGSAAATGGLNAFGAVPKIAGMAGTYVTPTAWRGAAPTAGADLRWWQGWTNYARN